MGFLLVAFSTPIAFLSWYFVSLYVNYREACLIGLPVITTSINVMNPAWVLTQPWLIPLLKRVPFGLCDFVSYSSLSWAFVDKHALHDRLGDAFVIAGPAENQVIVANADTVEQITIRRKDFQKAEAMYKPLEVFGPNLDTVEGETWQRHRRITTPPFNERNSAFVWRESMTQAKDMLQSWMTGSSAVGITTTDSDIMTLALHVLTAAGFGKSYSFAGGLAKPAGGHSMTYKDALKLILKNVMVTIIISSARLPAWMLPRKVLNVSEAIANFKSYMIEMVEEERDSIAKGEGEKDNLMSVLVRAAELSKAGEKGRNSLTDEEIFGNLFIYNLAGHETTANTLAYAVALIAANRDVQDWIGEEIEAVFGSDDTLERWQYEKAFPQLKRCLALMYETLRLYSPVFFIPRYTNNVAQSLDISGREYTIPAKTYVSVNSIALHTMPRYWGSDSLVWRPNRWIICSSDAKGLEGEEFLQPPPGSYVPWANGPRICPGKKFARVEFVAVISCLLRRHRVKPVLLQGECYEDASKRILKLVEDSEVEVTLKMNHPDRVKLRWTQIT